MLLIFTSIYAFMFGALFVAIDIILVIIYISEIVSYLKIYKNISRSLGNTVYGCLDKKGNLIGLNDDFFDAINALDKKNKWTKLLKNIIFENECITYKEFLEVLKTNEGSLNFIFEFEDESFELTFRKIPILNEGELIGYGLAGLEEIPYNNANVFTVMDELDSPCAFYQGLGNSTNFTLNRKMQTLLSSKEKKMTYSSLKKYVYEEDIENFNKIANEKANDITVQYRLITSQGLMMFEEVKHFENENVTSMLMNIESVEEDIYLEYNELNGVISDLITKEIPFGGVLVSLKSLLEEEVYSKNILKDIIKQYFKNIRKELLNGDDVIIKLNEFEYVVVIKDTKRMDAIVNDIFADKSILHKYQLSFGDKIIAISNRLAVAYYDNQMKTKKDYMKALFRASALVNNDEYGKDYSIYSVPKDELPEDEEYSFEKYKIDLDNSFLYEDE